MAPGGPRPDRPDAHCSADRWPIGAEQLLWFDLVAMPFGVIRRAMFPDDLAVDPGLRSCEDWDLWLRCAQTRPIATLPAGPVRLPPARDDRVTREGSGPVLGRQGFLDKHACVHVALVPASTTSWWWPRLERRPVRSVGTPAPPTTGHRWPPRWPCRCWPPGRWPVPWVPADGIPDSRARLMRTLPGSDGRGETD